MNKEFFLSSQLDARAAIYAKFHEELEKTRWLHKMALHEIKNELLVEHENFIQTKTTEAFFRIKEEEQKNRVKTQEKLGEINEFLSRKILKIDKSSLVLLNDLHTVMTALMGVPPSCLFIKMMTKSKKIFLCFNPDKLELISSLEDAVYAYACCFENEVEQAWNNFKDNVISKAVPIASASTSFKTEVDRYRTEFESKSKLARDGFLKKDGLVYAEALIEPLDEFLSIELGSVRHFCFEMDRMVEEHQKKVEEGVAETKTYAESHFDAEIKEARTSCNTKMEKARKNFQFNQEGRVRNPGEEINKLRDVYLKAVEGAWKIFKEQVSTRKSDVAAKDFQYKIDFARNEFQERTLFLKHELVTFIRGRPKEDFETDVKQALEEFVWLVSSVQKHFCGTMDQIVGRGKVDASGTSS